MSLEITKDTPVQLTGLDASSAPAASLPAAPLPEDAGYARLTGEIADRLRPVCTEMERERFEGLVADVARFNRRWSDAAGRRDD